MNVFLERAPWFVAGPILGLVILGLFWVANKPLGAVGAYVELHRYVKAPVRPPPWRVFFLVGLLVGGFLSGLLAGGVSPTLALDAAWGQTPLVKGAVLLGGGVLMGLGARFAGGCTAGHAMCGTSVGSPASFVASATFMATAIGTAHLLSWVSP